MVTMPDTSRVRDLYGRWLLLLSLEVLYFIVSGIKQAIQSLAAAALVQINSGALRWYTFKPYLLMVK